MGVIALTNLSLSSRTISPMILIVAASKPRSVKSSNGAPPGPPTGPKSAMLFSFPRKSVSAEVPGGALMATQLSAVAAAATVRERTGARAPRCANRRGGNACRATARPTGLGHRCPLCSATALMCTSSLLALADPCRPGAGRAGSPAPGLLRGLSRVERPDVGIGAAVEAVGVGVPEPHVEGHQVRVPEGGPRSEE